MDRHSIATTRRQAGFTLVELMAVIAIGAILAVVAVPGYNRTVQKNRRMAAESFLMDIAQRQQQYLLDSRAYAADLSALGLGIPDSVASYYNITCCDTTATPPTFRAAAAPTGGQASDACQTLVIDSAGKKDTSPSGIVGCW